MFLNWIKIPLSSIKEQALSRKELRKFGLSLSLIIFSLFGFIFPWFWSFHYPLWPWSVSALLAAVSLVNAYWIKAIYIVFMCVAHVLGTINISILLSVVFYFLMLPIGTILRIIGRDPMSRKFKPEENSYRIIRNDTPKERLERPF